MTFLLSILLFSGMLAQAQDVVVIANQNVETNQVSKDDLLKIYAVKQLAWTDGSRIVVLDVDKDDPVKDRFYSSLGRRFDMFKQVWVRKKFNGDSNVPISVKTYDDLIQLVRITPGAVGYVPANQVPEGVKVIARL